MTNRKKSKIKNIKIIGLVIFFLVGTFISFFININKEIIMIDLTNYTEEEVINYVNKYKIDLEKDYQYSDSIETNKVIKQSIPEGKIVTKGSKLKVTISLGVTPTTLYKEYKVNELGEIPIMMYHGIKDMNNSDTTYTGGNYDKDGYQRTKEAFINDLEMYYEKGYRMIRLNDFINGIIDVELGKSPIILTFDDGNINNFKVLGRDENGELIIDPNCAVGILESFKEKYPDFNVTATFFLNGGLFSQPEYNNEILSWLVNNGYDIGNHTKNHINIKSSSKDLVIENIGYMYQLFDKIIPNQYVNIIALPFGSPYNKGHNNFKYILEGSNNQYNYKTDSTLKVGATPNVSPFHINFDRTFLNRVRAWDNNGKEFDIEMTFEKLEKTRYISSGNKDIIVIPKNLGEKVNKELDKEIITYEVE